MNCCYIYIYDAILQPVETTQLSQEPDPVSNPQNEEVELSSMGVEKKAVQKVNTSILYAAYLCLCQKINAYAYIYTYCPCKE